MAEEAPAAWRGRWDRLSAAARAFRDSGRLPWLTYAVLCQAVAVGVLVYGLTTASAGRNVGWFGIVLALAVAQAELSRRFERRRQAVSEYMNVNVTTVWLVIAVAMLDPGWSGLLALLAYAHMWTRSRWNSSCPCDRMLASSAIMVISAWGASELLHRTALGALLGAGGIHTVPAVIIGAVTMDVVNALLVAVAIYLRTGTRKLTHLFGSLNDNALEYVTLCLGVMATALLASPWPYAVVIVLPPLFIVHRAALTDELETQAVTDHKTNILNSAGWEQHSESALVHAERRNQPVAVLMIDVDNFKGVNDSYGHLAGDDVLREIANAITSNVRSRDIVGRYGGEEFVVLMPGTTKSAAAVVAERIRAAAVALHVPIVTDNGPDQITDLSVSIGMASYPDVTAGLTSLLDAADTALYAAKHSGRNRLVQWHELTRKA